MAGVCDLGNAAGGPGPAGGTPAAPVCEHGTRPARVSGSFFQGKPYFTVAKPDPLGCENEGAYPAVDPATGALYTAYEYNWFTDRFAPCNGAATPTADVMTSTPLPAERGSCFPSRSSRGGRAGLTSRVIRVGQGFRVVPWRKMITDRRSSLAWGSLSWSGAG